MVIYIKFSKWFIRKFTNSFLQKWLIKISIIILFIVVIRTFCFDVFVVRGSSMENCLFSKDLVVINKLVYGPMFLKKRLSGLKKIELEDLVVFCRLDVTSNNLIKRVIARAGDTIKIRDGVIYTNNKIMSPETTKYFHNIQVKNKYNFLRKLDSLNIRGQISNYHSSTWNLQGSFSVEDAMIIEKLSCVKTISISHDSLKTPKSVFANGINLDWTVDKMGPITIPQKGMRIVLNKINLDLYEKTIRKYENTNLIEEKGRYYLNDKQITTYTFKLDYIFIVGDNRKYSYDSRHYGFVPENYIVGKAVLISRS